MANDIEIDRKGGENYYDNVIKHHKDLGHNVSYLNPMFLGVKYHLCCKDFNCYWVQNNILWACTVNNNHTIDLDTLGAVDDFSDQAMSRKEMLEIRNHVLTELIE